MLVVVLILASMLLVISIGLLAYVGSRRRAAGTMPERDLARLTTIAGQQAAIAEIYSQSSQASTTGFWAGRIQWEGLATYGMLGLQDPSAAMGYTYRDTWRPATSYELDDIVLPTAVNGGSDWPGFAYRCTVAGTAGVAEPTWPTSEGDTVIDNGATWEATRAVRYATRFRYRVEPLDGRLPAVATDAMMAGGLDADIDATAWAPRATYQTRYGGYFPHPPQNAAGTDDWANAATVLATRFGRYADGSSTTRPFTYGDLRARLGSDLSAWERGISRGDLERLTPFWVEPADGASVGYEINLRTAPRGVLHGMLENACLGRYEDFMLFDNLPDVRLPEKEKQRDWVLPLHRAWADALERFLANPDAYEDLEALRLDVAKKVWDEIVKEEEEEEKESEPFGGLPEDWQANTVYLPGDWAAPTTLNGFRYECTATAATTGGKTAASEPDWPTTPGDTVLDNDVTWTCRSWYPLPYAWQASTEYVAGDWVVPQSGVNGSYVYECTKGGTSDTSQPAFPTTIGGTVADGGVTWTCREGYPTGTPWQANTGYTVGEVVVATSDSTQYRYVCTTPGSTAASKPTWPTTPGESVPDNGVTWTCVAYRRVGDVWRADYPYRQSDTVVPTAPNGYRYKAKEAHSSSLEPLWEEDWPRWKQKTKYAMGDIVLATQEQITGDDGNPNLAYYAFEVVGVDIARSDDTEPTWPAKEKSTKIDNNITWTCETKDGDKDSWEANTPYEIDDIVLPTVDNGKQYRVTERTGTSGPSDDNEEYAPEWNITDDGMITVEDNLTWATRKLSTAEWERLDKNGRKRGLVFNDVMSTLHRADVEVGENKFFSVSGLCYDRDWAGTGHPASQNTSSGFTAATPKSYTGRLVDGVTARFYRVRVRGEMIDLQEQATTVIREVPRVVTACELEFILYLEPGDETQTRVMYQRFLPAWRDEGLLLHLPFDGANGWYDTDGATYDQESPPYDASGNGRTIDDEFAGGVTGETNYQNFLAVTTHADPDGDDYNIFKRFYVPGKTGDGRHFRGRYLSAGLDCQRAGPIPQTDDYTLAFWIYPIDQLGDPDPVHRVCSTNGLTVDWNAATESLTIKSSGKDPLTSKPNVPEKTWSMITITRAVDPEDWQANTVYLPGDWAAPTTLNGFRYECTAPTATTGGKTAASEPDWPTTPGDTVLDNDVTWTCRSLPYAWQASTEYVAGDWVVPQSGVNGSYVYECTKGGTSDTSQPEFPTTIGGTVADGGVTWTCRKGYTLRLYIDGKEDENSPAKNPAEDEKSPADEEDEKSPDGEEDATLVLGDDRAAEDNQNFYGVLDEVRWWGRALPEGEVRLLYAEDP